MKLPPAVMVHCLAQVRIAMAAGSPVTLLSGPGAALYAGAGWWRALMAAAAASAHDHAPPPDILDCGAAPGRALEAARAGQRLLVLRTTAALFTEAAGIAQDYGATVLPEAPESLDLGRPGAARRLGAWLAAAAHGTPGEPAPPP